MQVATLQTKLEDLKDNNQRVANANVEISNARLERNKVLYIEDNGLVDTAAEAKKYIKSVFGASSPEFAQIKGIAFKSITA